jgi:hypothetical protein
MLPIVVGSLIYVLQGKTPFDLRVMQPSGIGGIAWMNAAAAFAVAGAVSLAGSYSAFLYFQF